MKTMVQGDIFVLSVIIALCMQIIFCGLCLASEKEGAGTVIELRGTIVNLKEASKYINAESYLQLLFVPENDGISFETDENGRTVYPSTLPKSSFSKNGTFCLKVKNIKPGKYVIVGQKLNPYAFGSGVKPILSSVSNKKPVIIQHPKNTKNKNIVNFGYVFLPIPEN